MISPIFFVIYMGMRILICLFALLLPLFAEEEIIVHLASQEALLPIYLAPIQQHGNNFAKNYAAELEKVIRFDFNNNGKTEISSQNKSYRLEFTIHGPALNVKLINGQTGKVKGVEGIVLTGELHKDRQTLHQIHDTLFESLFQMPGIASSRILYTLRSRTGSDSKQWASDVWVADYDGANAHQVTHDGCLCVTPVFVPATQGRCANFLYVSYKIGQPKLFAASLAEGAGKRLTYLRGNQLMPAISPTLDKIAFISDITGNPDLFIQDFSLEGGLIGKPRQIFSAPGATQGTPTFSPDGKKLAFVSNKDGTPRIYILEIPQPGASIKTLKPKMISKKSRDNTCPAWSPDGKKIAYSGMVSGVRQICIYDLATGEEIQLTDGAGHKENPAWAPDALHLLFNSSTPTVSELYLVNLNQKKAVKLSGGPGEKRFPAWEPCYLTQRKL